MSPIADFPVTAIIIAITCIVSFMAFSNGKLMDDLIFHPPTVTGEKQWYRFVTYGIIHADVQHLAFNMISLYFLGKPLEFFLNTLFQEKGRLVYVLLYVTSLIVCLLPTFAKNKNNYYYRTLGASGAVSAVVFAFIVLAPTANFFWVIPGFVYGPAYLYFSARLDKNGSIDGINHSAHIWGAIYGAAFIIVSSYVVGGFNAIENFIFQITYWIKSF